MIRRGHTSRTPRSSTSAYRCCPTFTQRARSADASTSTATTSGRPNARCSSSMAMAASSGATCRRSRSILGGRRARRARAVDRQGGGAPPPPGEGTPSWRTGTESAMTTLKRAVDVKDSGEGSGRYPRDAARVRGLRMSVLRASLLGAQAPRTRRRQWVPFRVRHFPSRSPTRTRRWRPRRRGGGRAGESSGDARHAVHEPGRAGVSVAGGYADDSGWTGRASSAMLQEHRYCPRSGATSMEGVRSGVTARRRYSSTASAGTAPTRRPRCCRYPGPPPRRWSR